LLGNKITRGVMAKIKAKGKGKERGKKKKTS